MSADWAGIAITVLVAAITGAWAVLRWSSQRRAERLQSRQLVDSLYLNPFLFAADDLQSRLFNLLDRQGLDTMQTRDPVGQHAMATLYLVARYFAWEQQMLRFTYFAFDSEVVQRTRDIRDVLSTDERGMDDWCIFRTVQTALGQSVLTWREGSGVADVISLVEFEEERKGGSDLVSRLGLTKALDSLSAATTLDDLPRRTIRRLADVQTGLVDLLDLVEARLAKERKAPFTLAPETGRHRSAHASNPSQREHGPSLPPA